MVTITNDRLREIAANEPTPFLPFSDVRAMAAELLAARERIDELGDMLAMRASASHAIARAEKAEADRDLARAQFAAEQERHAITARNLAQVTEHRDGLVFHWEKAAKDLAEAHEELKAARAEVDRLKAEHAKFVSMAVASDAPAVEKLARENADLRAYRERTEAALDRFTSFVTKMVAVTEWRGMRWISEDGVMQKLNELGLAREAKESGHG